MVVKVARASAMRRALRDPAGADTQARSVLKLTEAVTPSRLFSGVGVSRRYDDDRVHSLYYCHRDDLRPLRQCGTG